MAGDIPAELLKLIDGWNQLGDQIVMRGNGARRDPPAKDVLSGWEHTMKNPDQREVLSDMPAFLKAIKDARFCHRQG